MKKIGFDPATYDWYKNPLKIGTDANPNPTKHILTKEEADFLHEEIFKRCKNVRLKPTN